MLSTKARSRLFLVLTSVVSIGCLFLTLRDAHLAELKDDLADMNWTFVALGVGFDILVYLTHAWRWRLVLKPVASVPYWDSVRAIYIGLFANEVIPFRAGELIRCFLLAQWTEELPFSVSLSSALIERIFDGIWLTMCLLVMTRFVPFPRHLQFVVDGGYLLGIIVAGAALLVGIAMARRPKVRTAYSASRVRRSLQILVDDLSLIGHSRYLYFAALVSLAYLLMQVLPIYAVLQGYGFDLSIGVAFVLMVVLRLGSVPPQAPGNIGVFQFLTKLTLERVFHVVPAEAARFSLVLWGVVTVPLVVVGFAAMLLSGSGLWEIHRNARTGVENHHEQRRQLNVS